MDRIPVARSDWKASPMGPRSAVVCLDIPVDDEAMRLIRLGLLPDQMEDKWFLFYEEPYLHCHRSWTGLEAFTIQFEKAEQGYRVKSVRASQNVEEINFENADEGVAEALAMVSVCLLGADSSLVEDAPIHAWHVYGRQIIGEAPAPGKAPREPEP